VNVTWQSPDVWTLVSGSEIVLSLTSGSATVEGNTVTVTFGMVLNDKVLDANDVDVYGMANDDSWSLTQTSLFHIYNLGGFTTLTSSGNAGRLAGGDAFDLYAEPESWVEANVTWRNLQHVKLLPIFSMEGAAYYSTIEFYFDYYLEDSGWLQGWGFMANITGILSTPDDRYMRFNVTWFSRGSIVKSQNVTMFFDIAGGNVTTRFWIDLWFNRINASSTVGGRINAYYFPMENNAASWLRWLTGNNWGPNQDLTKQSMMFTDLRNDANAVIHASQVIMTRVRCKLSNLRPGQYAVQLSDFDIFDITIGTSPLQGIQTPVFEETKVPLMPQGGFLGAVVKALGDLANEISDFFGPAVLGLWNLFVGPTASLGSLAS